MKSYKAAISSTTRKRLFSETIQRLFCHDLFEGLSCFTTNQCVVLVGEQFAWPTSESLGKEKQVQGKAPRGVSKSKPSKAAVWVRPCPELFFCKPRLAIPEQNR